MSDLLRGDPPVGIGGNGRTQNGQGRVLQGPTPIYAEPPRGVGVRTPTDVMRERRAREARKRAEQEAAQKAQEDEEDQDRMRQQEEDAVGVVEEQPSRRTSGGRVLSGGQYASVNNPRPRTNPGQQTIIGSGRAENIPLPAQQQSVGGRLLAPDQGQSAGRQQGSYTIPTVTNPRRNPNDNPAIIGNNSIQDAAPQITQQYQLPGQEAGRAGFPHAFERWETLSSHWEGLTSYWIRRLRENSNELNSKPIDQQMSRQITDLSAAGANLFHAVVELQRLRASSERKFQRWFLETRDEQERAAERLAELERQLRIEKDERNSVSSTISAAQAERIKAEELVREMRRELHICKGEARRAWEELGRREQEVSERTIALRSGEPTTIGGVQVVPMQGVPSRQTSTAVRPTTRDGPYPGGPGPSTMGGLQPAQQPPSRSQTTTTTLDSPENEQQQFTFQAEGESPTGTDPFVESSGGAAGQYYPTTQRPSQPPTSSTAIAAARAATSAPSPSRGHAPTTRAGASDLEPYQQPGTETTFPNPITTTAGSTLHPPARSGTAGTDPSDVRSYIPSTASGNGSSVGEEEYQINPDGSYARDARGRRIPYDPSSGVRQAQPQSDDGSDEFDVAREQERERQHLQRYGSAGQSNAPRPTSGQPLPTRQLSAAQQRQLYATSTVPPQGQSISTSTAQQSQPLSQSSPSQLVQSGQSPVSPDYDGRGYGGNTGWENITATPRHRHPTRLSDIIEERSGRTTPSRASQVIGTDVPMPPMSSAAGYSRR